ncbi:glucuronate isomerase [Paenibacillus sp. MMS20-IR301]|uniref:glucuronate isomerase n=1 Tax=Paenibacillus sp. MMS20-IR301 TaxID=2895946 RepID=UPI0028F114A9|nr:glucuronate isomerase [Paenibacillus sp. MMS20-IR301]WNS45417.1 glucuronate isomerase [Paenibacillus sp. MMS20-IR301]
MSTTPFIHDDWLLQSKSAQTLYHDYAAKMPVYDFHSHLNPQEISSNRKFRNIADLALSGDHYKWRALRWLGIDEQLITGDASDKDKFMAWARSVPEMLGNPLYHWTHLELKRYFGIDDLLSAETAESIWERCNEQLQGDELTTQGILKRLNVDVVCTTDDPVDSLEHHIQIKEDRSLATVVAPTFRPDRVLNIRDEGFATYVAKLGEVSGMDIRYYGEFMNAVTSRINYFHKHGCRLSDQAFGELPLAHSTEHEAAYIFARAFKGEEINALEEQKFQSYTLLKLGRLYHERGWSMQLHIGAIRNNNSRMFSKLGRDSGFDSILDFNMARSLNSLLNDLDASGQLPQTIVYTLNPTQYEMIATTIGNFQGAGVKGKVQMGSGWWFHDQKDGMLQQLKALSSIGLISPFVGMLTDSRSFLSFTRHEYFRRILCNLFGTWIEEGELPRDYAFVGKTIENICYNNADAYFGIK